MKEETRDVITEIKQKQYLDKIYAGKVREFDDYFKPTNLIEVRVKRYRYEGKNYSQFVAAPEEYKPLPTAKKLAVYNDMSKYKLEKDRIDKTVLVGSINELRCVNGLMNFLNLRV